MKKIIISAFLVCFTSISFGQIDFEDIINSGTGDAQALLKGYLSPLAVGFGNGINGGWYTTAKAHKFLGIDIAVIANAAIVPEGGETYTFQNTDNIKFDDPNITSGELPTILGSGDLADRPLLEYTDSNGDAISVSSLPGFKEDLIESVGYNAVPSAMIQAGIGLFKNTDLKVRFIPKQSVDNVDVSSYGFGIMHDIKQWIPVVKKMPFDLSGFVGWNNIESKFFVESRDTPSEFIELNTKTFMWQVLASKKLSIFTVFAGLGSTSFETDLNIEGFSNPIGLQYEGSSFRANAGLSIKFLFLNISAEYAKQEYDVVSLRAGITFR
ncbi:DUF6588 family protein [uncultured Polaribacter sp.]|uniref:DUF6588 family protein n=1 Tax=uncultured Polaribacter sp. TaxID=174711 RepID=UPI0026294CA7|nr:DUF6588 family protein [uncultured Polaribacter sp.]